ncbi:MAG: short-chain fatty acid transporter [Bacteroidetes bacterium]|nr:short-chain fatty acid transporter [Bacteroidia bacterium]PCH68810.1 MAG: short-chain fatty acid transporter [Bacteroidota bacterium]
MLAERFIKVVRMILPMPFTIAVILTLFTVILAIILTDPIQSNNSPHFMQILEFWELGFWDLLKFGMQMTLMLVFGHVLALTKPIQKLIDLALKYCTNTSNSAAIVTVFTLLVTFFNWGLGLIFGAIFARKVAEYAVKNNMELNYPLIGAAGYSGLMIWHGGLSGSAPIKVSEEGHFLFDQIGQILMNETVFSSMNITISMILLLILPCSMYWLGGKVKAVPLSITKNEELEHQPSSKVSGAEKLDHSSWFCYLFAILILIVGINKALIKPEEVTLRFINPDFINFMLLGLGLALHGTFSKYLYAVESAIKGTTGIIIQFPIYAGIMGIMKYSGLVMVFSDFFVQISNQTTFPIFTFISAALVNIFVPSGGGQWAVQGPIIVETAMELGVSIPKCIMALAYGDQLTNMMQPFWALPLLGITGLKAKEILPFTLFLMCIGAVVFISGLLIF